MFQARFCYSTVTPESAENGDFEEHGFYMPGGWRFPITHTEEDAENRRECTFTLKDFDSVISTARNLGITEHEGANWFYSHSSVEDYSTGEEVEYTLHIEGVTPSSYARIARLLSR